MSNSVTAVQAAGAVAPALNKPGAVAPALNKPGAVAPALNKPGAAAPAPQVKAPKEKAKRAKPRMPIKATSPFDANQRKVFLAAITESPNITAACRKAKVHSIRVYAERLASDVFSTDWDRALATGYVRLEAYALELTLSLTTGALEAAEITKIEKELKLINAQLAHHRATVRGEGAKPKASAQTDVRAANLRVEAQLRLQRRRRQALHGKG